MAAALFVVVLVTVVTFAVERSSGSHSAQSASNDGADSVATGTASPSTRARIVALVRGQVGYTTDPSNTYCNQFSAYWTSGPADCGNANRDEQWCADFAAWAWRRAGVPLTYQFINGDINSSSASFYEWGLRHHTWHPVGSNYVPQPGDVAVYGMNISTLVAQHVAVVVSYNSGASGPNAVNGDGDHTGFSRVEYQSDEVSADTANPAAALLAGYVAPSG